MWCSTTSTRAMVGVMTLLGLVTLVMVMHPRAYDEHHPQRDEGGHVGGNLDVATYKLDSFSTHGGESSIVNFERDKNAEYIDKPIPDVNTRRQHFKPDLKAQPSRFRGWTELFRFVPHHLPLDCTDLFSGRPLEDVLPANYIRRFKDFSAQTAALNFNVKEGYSATFPQEHMTYHTLVTAPFVKTVCETGFNLGHSVFTWLAAKNDTMVYSFDIGRHDYSKPMAERLIAQFPGRLVVTWGDSKRTLPEFRRKHPDVRCDLVIVDGGHTEDVCHSDMHNFRFMVGPDNIVLLDNYPATKWPKFMRELGPVWERARQNAHVFSIFSCLFGDKAKKGFRGQGFSVGKLVPAGDGRQT